MNSLGCFYGLIIGNLLGSSYENFGKNGIENSIKNNTIHGFLHINLANYMNNMELPLLSSTTIIENGSYDKYKIALQYIEWFNRTDTDFITPVMEYSFYQSNDYLDIINNSRKYNIDSLTNDILIRLPPYAIYGCSTNTKQQIIDECMLSNPNPICIDIAYIYVVSIQNAIMGMGKKLIMEYAIQKSNSNITKNILIDSKINRYYNSNDPNHIAISFQASFYELYNGSDFYNSMINIIRMGGSTTINCMIVGCLLGSFYGNENIPHKWVNSIHQKYNLTEIDDMIESLTFLE